MQVQHHTRGSSSIPVGVFLARNLWFGRRLFFLVILILMVSAITLAGIKLANAQSPVIYYVDCVAGNDVNLGTSATLAWKSIQKANKAVLMPGDKLLLKRGCQWRGPLNASWIGTAAQPIVISAYGSGNLPIIQDSYSTNVQISGSYQTIEYIETFLSVPPNPDTRCNNQPVGWKLGFTFGGKAAYNTVQYSKASKLAVGFFFANGSAHNKILNNTITDNNVVWEMAVVPQGPAGILLHGDYNEIGYNYFTNNRGISANNSATCPYSGTPRGISIELYGARNSNIHHNQSFNDLVFAELGSSGTSISADNVFAYNLHVVGATTTTTNIGPRFVVTRGQGISFGPVWRTKVYNNTIYYTRTGSKGVTCDGCAPEVLTVKNNIFWVDKTPISSDGPFIEENNILWSSDGKPSINFVRSLTSKVANPGFIDVAANNFSLNLTSPAREAGSSESLAAGYNHDLVMVAVPQVLLVDAGAYEAPGSASPTQSPTPSPTPEPSQTPPPTASPTPSPTPSLIATCSININDGAIYSGSSVVQVRANVPNAAQLLVGTDAGFTGATWQPYQTQFNWTLPDTGGRIATLLVYVRFVDASGTPLCGGSQLSDDIIYDPVPPTLSVAAAAASASAQADASDGAYITLAIDAFDQDNGSGVEGMQISLEDTFSEPAWQPFNSSVVIDAEGSQTLYVRVRDGSGNISEVVSVPLPAQIEPSSKILLPQITR